MSTGRAGSTYIAAVMSKAGPAVSHETHFNVRNYDDGGWPKTWPQVGEWSAQAVPILDRLAGWTVWHQVRHPLKVIGSFLGFGLMHDPRQLGPEGVYIAEHAPYLGQVGPVAAAVRFYVDWNLRCEAHAHRRWRVEDVDGALVSDLLNVDETAAEAAVQAVSTSLNHKPGRPPQPVGWGDLPDDVWTGRLHDMADRYGYDRV